MDVAELSADVSQEGQPGLLAKLGQPGDLLSRLMNQRDPAGIRVGQLAGPGVLGELGQRVVLSNRERDIWGAESWQVLSWAADLGSHGPPSQLQLQAADKAGADQGANQGRDWLPHGMEELQEGRTGGEGKAGSGSGQEGAGFVLRQAETLIKVCLL